MSAKTFYLVKRRDRLTNGKATYYCRFRDDSGALLPWRSTGETAKARAENWALAQFRDSTITTRTNITFGTYADPWWIWDRCDYIRGKLARGKRISRSYADNQRGNLERYILPVFKDSLLAKITPQMVETWVMALADRHHLAAVSVNHILATAKVMFGEAFRLGIIPGDPAAKVAPLQEKSKEREVLTLAEIRKLFREDRIPSIWNGDERLYTASLLGVSCGLRMAEIQALQIRSIGDGFLMIDHAWERSYGLKEPKYGSRRQVPLPARTERHVKRISLASPYQEPDDLLFYGADRDTPIDHKHIGEALTRALSVVGIAEAERRQRGLTFHGLRHTFNSIMRGRVPDHVLRSMTGHRTQQMVEHYSHVGTDDLAGVLKAQREVFG